LQKHLFIAGGGALGSLARFWVGSTIANRFGMKFPYWTFVVNITACLIIWLFIGLPGKACRAKCCVAVSNSDRFDWGLQYVYNLRMGLICRRALSLWLPSMLLLASFLV
jgi:hypothetical protein